MSTTELTPHDCSILLQLFVTMMDEDGSSPATTNHNHDATSIPPLDVINVIFLTMDWILYHHDCDNDKGQDWENNFVAAMSRLKRSRYLRAGGGGGDELHKDLHNVIPLASCSSVLYLRSHYLYLLEQNALLYPPYIIHFTKFVEHIAGAAVVPPPPPLPDHLHLPSPRITVIITTSPTLSNPSTELMQDLLDSFVACCPELLSNPLIVVGDGCIQGTTCKWKSGQVNPIHATNYTAYLDAVESTVLPKYYPNHATLIRLCGRAGFGYAVRSALELVTTPYVIVIQHDYIFIKPFSLAMLLACMDAHPDVLKYVGFLSKFTMEYIKRRVHVRAHGVTSSEIIHYDGVPFARQLFWYDKTHIAQTSWYRSFVYEGPDSCVKKGDFPEDQLGQKMITELKCHGIAAHAKYGTFLWYPMEGKEAYLRHLNGRRYRSQDQRVEIEAECRERHAKERGQQQPRRRKQSGDSDEEDDEGSSSSEDYTFTIV